MVDRLQQLIVLRSAPVVALRRHQLAINGLDRCRRGNRATARRRSGARHGRCARRVFDLGIFQMTNQVGLAHVEAREITLGGVFDDEVGSDALGLNRAALGREVTGRR